MKTCSKCKVSKELTEFYKRKTTKDGYRPECILCSNNTSKTWYEANSERRAATNKAWNEANPGRMAALVKAYRKANPDKVNALAAKRHAAKLQRTPKWLTKEHFKEIENIYTVCDILTKSTGIQFNVDHIVPLQGEIVSGLHLPCNLQVIPATENIKKGNKF